MTASAEVTTPEWALVHGIADSRVGLLTAALVEVWDAVRRRISVEDLGMQLSLSGNDNIDWRYEMGGLQGAMVNVAAPIARATALALLPRLEKGISTSRPTPVTEKFADWMDLEFDLRFMDAEKFLERYLPMLIVNINEETRRAIRDIVLSGFQVGKHPYQMAEEIQALVGMLPGQVRAYQAFAKNLAKGNMSANGQDVALAAYRTRAIEHRARNIARTETLRAANAGQLTLWDRAEANGLIGSSAKRVWINTPDEKICPFCDTLGDRTTTLRTPWVVEGVAVPAPPAHPSCRCAMGLEFGG